MDSNSNLNPLRGEVWWVELEVVASSRPVVVVNADILGNQPTRLIVPLTTRLRSEHHWQVLIEPTERNGLNALTVAGASQIRSIALDRVRRRLGVLDHKVIQRIADSIPSKSQSGFRPQTGKQIGKWKLKRLLGKGGNAEVWEASKEAHSDAAIKILRTGDLYRYRRFKAEVDLLLSLGEHAGVLPLIEAHLPDSRKEGVPAWLAMPIATGIRDALGEDPTLESVAESIASIAETLDALAVQDICHRDIKPGNLYQHENQWKIGDFGLAEYPSKEALTLPGRKLGPLHFMPDEMIENADTADGKAADVFSLAKTLWVLASGQMYPPQGQLRIDVPQLRLSNSVVHPRARILDLLIERATHHDPNQRPAMSEIARELRAWLNSDLVELDSPDISDLGMQLQAAVAPGQRSDRSKNQLIADAKQIHSALEQRLQPLCGEIARYNPLTHISSELEILLVAPYAATFSSPDKWWESTCCVVSRVSNEKGRRLSSGFGLRLTSDQMLTIMAAHLNIWHRVQVEWSGVREERLGSALVHKAIDELYGTLRSNLRSALQNFLRD